MRDYVSPVEGSVTVRADDASTAHSHCYGLLPAPCCCSARRPPASASFAASTSATIYAPPLHDSFSASEPGPKLPPDSVTTANVPSDSTPDVDTTDGPTDPTADCAYDYCAVDRLVSDICPFTVTTTASDAPAPAGVRHTYYGSDDGNASTAGSLIVPPCTRLATHVWSIAHARPPTVTVGHVGPRLLTPTCSDTPPSVDCSALTTGAPPGYVRRLVTTGACYDSVIDTDSWFPSTGPCSATSNVTSIPRPSPYPTCTSSHVCSAVLDEPTTVATSPTAVKVACGSSSAEPSYIPFTRMRAPPVGIPLDTTDPPGALAVPDRHSTSVTPPAFTHVSVSTCGGA